MSEALYRKYRPQKIAEVIGQEPVKTILQNAVREGRISHAYLFCGPRGVGKTSLARILAKAVNCRNPKNGEPDTTCVNCLAIAAGRFLDLLEIDAASYTGVDNIREVIDHVKFAPNNGKYKVFIIDEVHMLSKAAFNALLKTLEEPPAHAIFILATTEVHKVPATIISRSQRFDFRQLSKTEISKVLQNIAGEINISIEPPAVALIASAAEGSLRDALSILDQITSFGSAKISLEQIEEILGITRIQVNQRFLDFLIQKQPEEASQFIKSLVFEGKDIIQFTKNFLEYLRLVLFVKIGAEQIEKLGLSEDESQTLLAQARVLTSQRLLEIIKGVLEAYREGKTSPVLELPLLVQVLSLNHGGKEVISAEAKTFSRKAAPTKADPSNLTLGTIIDRWSEVLAKIKDYNHSLLGSLRLARIVGLKGLDLILAFPYNFHKETVEARKNRIVVEQVLEEVYGGPLKVKIHLERELNESADPSKKDLIGEAMKVLGGDED